MNEERLKQFTTSEHVFQRGSVGNEGTYTSMILFTNGSLVCILFCRSSDASNA